MHDEFVNKCKTSLELAKHIDEKVRKVLHQAVGPRESNVENRIRHSKIKSIGSQSARLSKRQNLFQVKRSISGRKKP